MISFQFCRRLRPSLQLALISFLGPLLCSAYALSAPLHPSLGFKPQPKVDSRGFIDVWQLRRDVAAVEDLMATEDTNSCYPEGDPDAPELSKKEIKAVERSERACVAKVERHIKAYRRALDSFNKAWLPVLLKAARRGDKVAEVILRQCDTTPVLDRSQFESTCDENPERRAIAISRLQQTGFEPAYLPETPPPRSIYLSRNDAEIDALQSYTFRLFKHGIFGRIDVSGVTNVDPEKNNVAAVRGQVIEAALQEVERAFTFSGNNYVNAKTDEFATLRVNRKPLTPGFMTQGKILLRGDGNGSGIRSWRWGLGIKIGRVEEFVGGAEEAEFIKQLREILITSKQNIDRHLKEDPRWGVFIINRVGHHEWVPEGRTSEMDKLGYEWVGQWKLEKVFKEGYDPRWTLVSNLPEATRARIYREGGTTRITFQSVDPPRAPLQDAVGCQLRYSGGLTFMPSSNPDDSVSENTVFGYQGAYPIPMLREVYKPLKSTHRYRQVLVQCPEGEWFDNVRTRHLFLAGNTMIERATETFGLTVRHFRRVAESASLSLKRAQPVASARRQSFGPATGRVNHP